MFAAVGALPVAKLGEVSERRACHLAGPRGSAAVVTS